MEPPRHRSQGFTLLELIVAVGVIGILLGAMISGGRTISARTTQNAHAEAFRALLMDGATLSASRSAVLTLRITGGEAQILSGSVVMRKVDVRDLTITTPPITFTPPGRLMLGTTAPITVTANGKTRTLRITSIGQSQWN